MENAVVAMLKKYGPARGLIFVNSPKSCDVLFTNDVFPEEVLGLHKPRVKRMDGVFWRENLKDRNAPYNLAATQADHVVFISQFSQRSLHELYGEIKLKNESVIVNWVDSELFPCIEKRVKTPKKWVAVATSWEREEKRFADLCRFATEVLDGELFLVGNCEKPVPKNVIVLGYKDYRELGETLRQMDALINLSYRDVAPKVVAEAICSGIPTLVAQSGGASEVCGACVAIPDFFEYCFESETPQLEIRQVKLCYESFVRNYQHFKGMCNQFTAKRLTKNLIDRYIAVFKQVGGVYA